MPDATDNIECDRVELLTTVQRSRKLYFTVTRNHVADLDVMRVSVFYEYRFKMITTYSGNDATDTVLVAGLQWLQMLHVYSPTLEVPAKCSCS